MHPEMPGKFQVIFLAKVCHGILFQIYFVTLKQSQIRLCHQACYRERKIIEKKKKSQGYNKLLNQF